MLPRQDPLSLKSHEKMKIQDLRSFDISDPGSWGSWMFFWGLGCLPVFTAHICGLKEYLNDMKKPFSGSAAVAFSRPAGPLLRPSQNRSQRTLKSHRRILSRLIRYKHRYMGKILKWLDTTSLTSRPVMIQYQLREERLQVIESYL